MNLFSKNRYNFPNHNHYTCVSHMELMDLHKKQEAYTYKRFAEFVPYVFSRSNQAGTNMNSGNVKQRIGGSSGKLPLRQDRNQLVKP